MQIQWYEVDVIMMSEKRYAKSCYLRADGLFDVEWWSGETELISREKSRKMLVVSGKELVERVEKLEETLELMLLSADCSWEERGEGHDWREACQFARKVLEVTVDG